MQRKRPRLIHGPAGRLSFVPRLWLPALLPVLLLPVPQANAADADSANAGDGPPEVIVTATKQSQQLSKVPISISWV